MTEPRAVAASLEEVVPGVRRWFVADDRIGGNEADAHAVAADGGVVLLDPLPLAEEALAELGDGVGRGLVLDGDRLVGFLSITDLVRALETGGLRRRARLGRR